MQQVLVHPATSADSAEVCLLRDILARKRIQILFQPIIDLKRNRLLGYEALSRGPTDTALHRPLELFDAAASLGLADELEALCRRLSIERYAELHLDGRLFLNISPGTLIDPGFLGQILRGLDEVGINPEQVVLEVTEQQKTHDLGALAAALTAYRRKGFSVALDDLGAGYSGLRLWTELLPDFIKIDKYFIRNIHIDRIKASFVASLQRMSSASDCQIIAEGVEKHEELVTLQKIGVSYVQGFLFSRPEAAPPRTVDLEWGVSCVWSVDGPTPAAGNPDLLRIARHVEPRTSDTPVREIVDYLQHKPELQLLPILKDGEPVGIINRHLFFNRLMATRFGVELYAKHPVSRLLEDRVILVDVNQDLGSVSQAVIANAVPEQAFIVTQNGNYYGVATILDLLELITEQRIQNARHANPLTLLPGIVPFNEVVNRNLRQGRPFAVAYFDLDHFKPYNDYYGYAAGDKVIQFVAGLLRECYPEHQALVGHIGGDDFIVIDFEPDFMTRIEHFLQEFARQIPEYYERTHKQNGGLQAIDRQGNTVFVPLTSVSVGAVPPGSVASCDSQIDVADLASEAKKLAKEHPGNFCFVNRREIVRGPG